MMIIVGLGNPGKQYSHSRHNMGFQAADRLQATGHSAWKNEKSLNSDISRIGDTVIVKPQTYMNLSGNAVKAALKKYDYSALGKKDVHNLFVIYDDLDIEVGRYKLIFGSGPKVHNGVNDIIEKLGTSQFWHVRIGVDGRKGDRTVDPQEYVLSGFEAHEQILINIVMETVVADILKKIAST